jgi:hypothetical protein
MKGQKPKEVGNTSLANGAGQGIGDSKREPVFTPHPGVQPPNWSGKIEDAQAGQRLSSSLPLGRRRLDWLLPKALLQQRLGDGSGDRLQQFLAFLRSCRPRLADDTDERAARKLAPTVDTGIDTRNR